MSCENFPKLNTVSKTPLGLAGKGLRTKLVDVWGF